MKTALVKTLAFGGTLLLEAKLARHLVLHAGVLDHFIVGGINTLSFAERGLL